jgi:hypothetical protein
MRSKHTGYVVAVRDVDLAREKGETDMLKVGAVIRRDLLAAAAMEGVFLGQPLARSPASRPEPQGRPSMPRPGASGAPVLNPPGPSFPFPMPYPRPRL